MIAPPDVSVAAVLIVFLLTLVALNRLLFKPLFRTLEERDRATDGLLKESHKTLEHYTEQFERYRAAVREGKGQGYKLQEAVRGEALRERAVLLQRAKAEAEAAVGDAKVQLREQVASAKRTLEQEVRDLAGSVARNILRRDIAGEAFKRP
ncbi:MAG: ATP synthase F0 subunit B [Acidobacteria bacterium]|nr:ATP synthase F0 subunit B [Acidobacteriota bacterium]